MRAQYVILALLGNRLTAVLVMADGWRAASGNSVVPGAYLVEFEDGHDNIGFYSNLSSTNIQVSASLNLSYTLFNGASFRLNNSTSDDEAVAQITAMAAVKRLWPMKLHTLSGTGRTSGANNPMAASTSTIRKRQQDTAYHDTWPPHVMTQVDQLRSLGFTGEGVKVAVIDSGVDYYHPALGAGFGEGHLIGYGYDLVGDDYDGSNKPVPDDDPLSTCDGHGTRVAGIIAAQPNEYNFTGAAPGVTLGMYRVFGCDGPSAYDVLIAAHNMAYEAGSDIITSAVGTGGGWSEDPLAIVVERIVKAGVPCITSAGNSGLDYGMFFAQDVSSGKGVTSVASVDNWDYPLFVPKGNYMVDNGTVSDFGWVECYPTFGNVALPLFATSNDSTVADDACFPLPQGTPDLSRYIVLIRRGSCDFVLKASYAAAHGAQYIMFYENTREITGTNVTSVSGILGSGFVTEEQGAAWVSSLNAGKEVYVTITDPKDAGQFLIVGTNKVTGGFASTFTTWGPTWELDLNPSVAGVGGNILSTYLTSRGSYSVTSGTSFSCPLVAAIFALVGQARGTFDPTILRNVLMATSKANLWNDGTTTYDVLAPVPQQGAGLVQAYDAAFTTTLLTPASISFNDTDHLTSSTSFQIANIGSETVTYTIGHVPALTVYTFNDTDSLVPAPFPNPTDSASAKLSFSSTTITVPAGSTANITVSPTPPSTLNATRLPVYSGYITINSTTPNAGNLTIPYLGVVGSMINATNLDPRPTSTYLYNDTDATRTPSPADTTFTLPYPPTLAEAMDPSANISYFILAYSLRLGSALVRIDIVPLDAGYSGNTTMVLGEEIAGSVHGYPMEWESRWLDESTLVFTGLFADGTIVPEGRYKLLIRALRIFGDRAKAEDYTRVETVAFNLVYL